MEHTLVLNATYEPLQVVSWKRAVRILFQEKAEVVAEYEHEIRSVSLTVRLPSVLRLRHYVSIKRIHQRVKFTRANIYIRDQHSCQYCGSPSPPEQLTYDHVIPVARGGLKSWENIVTCCIRCNRLKGNHLPEEVDLRLLRKPKAPNGFPHKIQFLLSRKRTPESWKNYIFWNLQVHLD